MSQPLSRLRLWRRPEACCDYIRRICCSVPELARQNLNGALV
ncbi:hypothetical protein [Rheinheimera soli]|uniref:Uncharacterized protein n=1 Tax=Rheinheimera soli TaxID=443616 RepID=A0ABU1VX21_9GAMM|nr:hypothetical protein [Rheinheimera soli]MDR7120130.1 hypothetical protein [Rheinheimera soli]